MAQLTVPEVQAIQAVIQPLGSKLLRCWKALELLLKTVDKAHGYSQDTSQVDSDQKDWAQVPDFECPRLEVGFDEQSVVYHAGCIREYTYQFQVYGLTRDLDRDAFALYMADVETAINDNNSLFGQANKMEVPFVLADQQFFPRIDGARMFMMTVKVEATRTARVAT